MTSSLLVTTIPCVSLHFINLISLSSILILQLRFSLHSPQSNLHLTSSIMPSRAPEIFTVNPPPSPYNDPAYISHWVADTCYGFSADCSASMVGTLGNRVVSSFRVISLPALRMSRQELLPPDYMRPRCSTLHGPVLEQWQKYSHCARVSLINALS